jgi:hypothetical protein
MNRPIWQGVYKSCSEVPVTGAGFSSDKWISNSIKKIERLRELAELTTSIPAVTVTRDSLLPVLAGLVYAEIQRVEQLENP